MLQAHHLGVSAGLPCLLVARFFYRHAHSSKHSTSLLYRTSSAGLRLDTLNFQPPNSLLQVSSRVQEDTLQRDAGTKMVKVKFYLKRRCEFGQQFNLIGNHELLGAWAPEAAIRMQWSEGHIWTSELDLSVGMCVEFKAILMADQEEVVEWQPGPNCKLEIPERVSSLVVIVPWSYEENLQNDVNHLQRTQDGDEFASAVGSFPDLVEDIVSLELGTHASTSMDVTEEQLNEDSSANFGTIKLNAKDYLDERHSEAKGILTGDQGAIDAETSLKPELISSKVLPLFAIPESWYGEESKTMSDILHSPNLTKSAPDFASGQTMISASEFSSDKEEKNGDKLVLLNGPNEVVAEVRARSMTVIDAKEENGEKLIVHVDPVEAIALRNIGTKFLDTEPKDINEEESGENLIVQNGPLAVVAEASLETTITSTVSNNGDEEAVIHNEPSDVTAEVPKTEIPNIARDLLENVEKEPSVIANDKKWSRKGWAKLWSALVKGHNDDGET